MRLVLLIFLFGLIEVFSQTLPPGYFTKKGEVYFRFKKPSSQIVLDIGSKISIDNVTKDSVFAYANELEFSNFLKYNLDYKVLPAPGDVPYVRMSDKPSAVRAWDSYPTYEAYVAMMQQFQTNYPEICTIVDAGNTTQSRKVLFAKISDNIGSNEPEAKVMLSSSMHGDETTGYVLMLRLIDYLLTNYGTNAQVTNLVNNLEIWINPAANPDGTYRTGNSTVSGATRYNANNVDINRNFPDPAAGSHPDGKAWQSETIAMMNVFNSKRFVISANFHGGAEVVNYPWDTWIARHADDNWWQVISRYYADTVHAHAVSGYMTFLNNGVTNGYDWYRVTGGRQDYMTYFCRGREVTIEISDTKLLPASQLPAHWEYNYRSFLGYLENALYGITGVVTNTSGQALKAKITIQSHDFTNSEIFSDSLTGDYHRMIYPGTYTVVVSADSHFSQTIQNVQVTARHATPLNIQLVPINPIPVELSSFEVHKDGNAVLLHWQTQTETNNNGFAIERRSYNSYEWKSISFIKGAGSSTTANDYFYRDTESGAGIMIYRLKQIDLNGSITYSDEVSVEFSSPLSFELNQNFPNPFNPSTVLSFTLPFESKVTISIYNTLGDKVDEFSDQKAAGSQSFQYTASHLTTGTYFYTISIKSIENGKEFKKTGKMLFLK